MFWLFDHQTNYQHAGQLHVFFDTTTTGLDGFVERTHRQTDVLDVGFGFPPNDQRGELGRLSAAENSALLTITPLLWRDFDQTNKETCLSSYVRRMRPQHFACLHRGCFNNTAVLASVLHRSARLSDGRFAVPHLNS